MHTLHVVLHELGGQTEQQGTKEEPRKWITPGRPGRDVVGLPLTVRVRRVPCPLWSEGMDAKGMDAIYMDAPNKEAVVAKST